MRYGLLALTLLGLSACAGGQARDYRSSEICTTRGEEPGTQAFEECVETERKAYRLDQQRKEFEERKREEDFWRNNRRF